MLVDEAGRRVFAFQEVPSLARPDWPGHQVPKRMHHDFRVPDVADLMRQKQRAEDLGATLLYDRTDDEGEPLFVLADPAGHPFCLLVSAGWVRDDEQAVAVAPGPAPGRHRTHR